MNGNERCCTGVVLIGRNEGERLKRSVASIDLALTPVVYVDSGSSDDSVGYCQAKGIAVVELDMSIPFTAARARNEGYLHLACRHPELHYVQFLDGDCELVAGWLATATDFLGRNPGYAAVCGRRRETNPDTSIYNRLCDLEWNTPIGDTRSCGGDVMLRVAAFDGVGGFNDQLIAGEEPELCFRLRGSGWRVHRLDAEMTRHDANLITFRQWWRRTQRAGYACTGGALLHGLSPERYYVKPTLRALVWGGLLPLTVFLLGLYSPLFLLVLLTYPVQYIRLVRSAPTDGAIGRRWAFFLLLGKFPEFMGLLQCLRDGVLSRRAVLIEYK